MYEGFKPDYENCYTDVYEMIDAYQEENGRRAIRARGNK
jgi:hypothetical protein